MIPKVCTCTTELWRVSTPQLVDNVMCYLSSLTGSEHVDRSSFVISCAGALLADLNTCTHGQEAVQLVKVRGTTCQD